MAATDAPPLGLTEEGGGVVATCKRCGWLTWTEHRSTSLEAGRGHKCRKEDLRPPGQRYPSKKGK